MRALAERFEIFRRSGRDQRGKIGEGKLVFCGGLARGGRAGGEGFFDERSQRQGIKFNDKTHANSLVEIAAKSRKATG